MGFFADTLAKVRRDYAAWRVGYANGLMSVFFGAPMQVVPARKEPAAGPQVTVAGAVVFWYLEGGIKHFVMLRQPEYGETADGRGRWLSCFGLGAHADMPAALRNAVKTQMGAVFSGTLPAHLLDADRVAAAPMFSVSDASGAPSPVQTLVWVAHLQPAQVDVIEPVRGVSVMLVPEFSMNSSQISPTHRAIFHAAARHLPKGRAAKEDRMTDAEVEASIVSAQGRSGKVIH